MRYGPLILILVFGLLAGGALIAVQAISAAIGSAADAYSAVGVVTAEESGQTDRWGIVTSFLSSIVGGATAALV